MYAYLVIVCLLAEGLFNAKMLKYRKTFNVTHEILVTCLNSFIPGWNLMCLVQNIQMIFKDEDTIKVMALILDLANIDKED